MMKVVHPHTVIVRFMSFDSDEGSSDLTLFGGACM